MIVALAMTVNLRGFLFLLGALIFGLLVVVGLAYSPRDDWRIVLARAAWCLGFVAWFLWSAGL